MSKLTEMLSTLEGRKALEEAIPLLLKGRDDKPRFEHAPIDRIAWCADHRINSLPPDLPDKLKVPVSLNRVVINGEPLYLVVDGNHRIERFVEAGRKTISATVSEWDIEIASLKRGVNKEYCLEKTGASSTKIFPNDITKKQAETLKALGIVKDETVPVPTVKKHKRRIFGFGIGD